MENARKSIERPTCNDDTQHRPTLRMLAVPVVWILSPKKDNQSLFFASEQASKVIGPGRVVYTTSAVFIMTCTATRMYATMHTGRNAKLQVDHFSKLIARPCLHQELAQLVASPFEPIINP